MTVQYLLLWTQFWLNLFFKRRSAPRPSVQQTRQAHTAPARQQVPPQQPPQQPPQHAMTQPPPASVAHPATPSQGPGLFAQSEYYPQTRPYRNSITILTIDIVYSGYSGYWIRYRFSCRTHFVCWCFIHVRRKWFFWAISTATSTAAIPSSSPTGLPARATTWCCLMWSWCTSFHKVPPN